MDLEYTPEQQRLRAEIRATLEEVMTPERTLALSERMEGTPETRECIRALAAANLGLLPEQLQAVCRETEGQFEEACRLLMQD